jgi:uncharacterized protein (TIGR00730 family)
MSHLLSPICIYCGAASGANPAYTENARHLGRLLGERSIGIVYGGGRAGLMGEVADAALGAGGTVTGIITRQLMDKELGHNGIHELRVVETMHERKMAMAQIARGFLALPGGVGTLDELFEILAWAQLGIHDHPIGLLNVDGFYDDLLRWLHRAEQDRFLRISPEEALVVASDPETLLDQMAAHQPRAGRPYTP